MEILRRFSSWWLQTFRNRSNRGKLGFGCLSLFIILLACGIPLTILSPPSETPTPTVQRAALFEPTDTPVRTPTREPTNTFPPTASPEPTDTAASSATPEPSATPAPTDTPTPSPTAESAMVEAQVVEVVDGDTIKVLIDGQEFTVRYIGIDTPETKDPNEPVQWMGPEASAANEELVGGKTVLLEKDVSETDQYGRLLRYVHVGDTFVNEELVRQGFAQVSTYPPDVQYADLFTEAQQEAREAGRGLWSEPPTPSPVPTQAPTQPPPTPVPTQPPPTPVPTEAPPTSEPTLPPPTPVPTQPPPTPVPTQAPTEPPAAGITLVSLTSPTSPGSNATLVIQVAAGAVCDPGVIYKSGESGAQGLEQKTAGGDGQLSWTWKVGPSTTPGTWTVYVNCNPGGSMSWAFVVQ
jgi:micrococcal nuclease